MNKGNRHEHRIRVSYSNRTWCSSWEKDKKKNNIDLKIENNGSQKTPSLGSCF